MNIEYNIRKSFRQVKNDIIEIKNQILVLAEEQEKIKKLIFSKNKKIKKSKTK